MALLAPDMPSLPSGAGSDGAPSQPESTDPEDVDTTENNTITAADPPRAAGAAGADGDGDVEPAFRKRAAAIKAAQEAALRSEMSRTKDRVFVEAAGEGNFKQVERLLQLLLYQFPLALLLVG